MEQPIEYVFSTRDVACVERRAYWCEEVSELWSATTFEWLTDDPSHGSIVMHSYAGSMSAECVNASARISRPKRLIEQAPDCYNLVLHLDGQGLYHQAGREITAAKGDLVLMEATEPFEMMLSSHHVRSWAVPRVVLEPLLADPSRAVNAFIPGGSVLGGVLMSYLGMLWNSFGHSDAKMAAALDSHLYYLVATALGGKRSELDDHWERCARAAPEKKHTTLDPGSELARRAWVLQERYGLTRAEAAFALEIVKGDGRIAAAKRRGITDSTAHSHLNSIFEKTGVRRQAELVRLMFESWISG